MKTESPPTRRKFRTKWDEIDYLYHKLLYWLYDREDRRKARPFAERLEQLLKKASSDPEAIFGHECWALVYEFKEDMPKAIKQREEVVRLIRRLHDISRDTPHWDFIKNNAYDLGDLSDHLDLLATLYHDSGDVDRAIRTLEESQQFCQEHGIPFDGQDVLREYLEEKRHVGAANGNRVSRRAAPRRASPASRAPRAGSR